MRLRVADQYVEVEQDGYVVLTPSVSLIAGVRSVVVVGSGTAAITVMVEVDTIDTLTNAGVAERDIEVTS